MMPKPRTPTALKELKGTAKKSGVGIIAQKKGIGPASTSLSVYEKEIWDEVVGHMYAGVLSQADRLALEMMCRLVAEMRLNFEDMTAAKITQLSTLLGRFGMTPSDRTKIVVPKEEAKNPFEAL